MTAGTAMAPRLRKDALRNRQLLVASAKAVFSERGLEASLDEIARRAGVGNATLYRRFPTREDLYEAVFADLGEDVTEVGERALTVADPWEALVGYTTDLCAMFELDRGLNELIESRMHQSPALQQIRESCQRVHAVVFERARAAGVIRRDVTLEDFALALYSLHRTLPDSSAVAPGAWRRQLAILMEAFRDRPDNAPLPGAPLTPDQLDQVTDKGCPPRESTS